jgi:hypothetical protein
MSMGKEDAFIWKNAPFSHDEKTFIFLSEELRVIA